MQIVVLPTPVSDSEGMLPFHNYEEDYPHEI